MRQNISKLFKTDVTEKKFSKGNKNIEGKENLKPPVYKQPKRKANKAKKMS